MKKRFFSLLLAFFLFFPAFAFAQLSLTTSGATVTIDFDATVSGVNNGAFAGDGFQPSPSAGQLNSNAWAMTGWSDGSLAFGGTQNSGDFARGTTTAAVPTGGVYALNDGGNRRFLIQPAASDWAPGTLTLRIQNNMGSPLRQIDIAYDLFVRNDQPRANSFNFSYSTDDASYTQVSSMDYTSPGTATNTFFLSAVHRLVAEFAFLVLIFQTADTFMCVGVAMMSAEQVLVMNLRLITSPLQASRTTSLRQAVIRIFTSLVTPVATDQALQATSHPQTWSFLRQAH